MTEKSSDAFGQAVFWAIDVSFISITRKYFPFVANMWNRRKDSKTETNQNEPKACAGSGEWSTVLAMIRNDISCSPEHSDKHRIKWVTKPDISLAKRRYNSSQHWPDMNIRPVQAGHDAYQLRPHQCAPQVGHMSPSPKTGQRPHQTRPEKKACCGPISQGTGTDR